MNLEISCIRESRDTQRMKGICQKGKELAEGFLTGQIWDNVSIKILGNNKPGKQHFHLSSFIKETEK